MPAMPPTYSGWKSPINPRARFHDGTPITARDVAFTFHKFMTEGVPPVPSGL